MHLIIKDNEHKHQLCRKSVGLFQSSPNLLFAGSQPSVRLLLEPLEHTPTPLDGVGWVSFDVSPTAASGHECTTV